MKKLIIIILLLISINSFSQKILYAEIKDTTETVYRYNLYCEGGYGYIRDSVGIKNIKICKLYYLIETDTLPYLKKEYLDLDVILKIKN